jgi:orotate phosphoribosyltransferase
LVREHGAEPVGVVVLVDRSAGDVDFGIPMNALLKLTLPTYQPTECPMCKKNIPIDKPGSK